MGKVLRVGLATLLVCFIVLIVVSPYIDLPLSTVNARQAALQALTMVLLCWAAAAVWQMFALVRKQELDRRDLNDGRLLELTGSLRC
jgi:hypothetical protein